MNAVMHWFGSGFAQLDPLLQALHSRDSRLRGQVVLRFGAGLGGVLGRHLARRLGFPQRSGPHRLEVVIGHDETTLRWHRCFDDAHCAQSSFSPHGRWPDGYWIERSGPLELELGVDVREGGWHWRTRAARYRGMRIPQRLMPRSTAYKRIENGRYRFHVAFCLPVLGEMVSYDGLLEADRRE